MGRIKPFSVVFLSIFQLSLVSQVVAQPPPSLPGAHSLKAALPAESGTKGEVVKPMGSEKMEAVRARIARMIAIVEGKEPKPTEASFLVSRSELADSIVKKLLASFDKGKVKDVLATELLIENEHYTQNEIKAVFTVDEIDLFQKLTADEKNLAAQEYTQARKDLRRKLLAEVAQLLAKEKDPRALLLAEAVKKTQEASQNSYDRALKEIKDRNRDSPICFSCGELVLNDYDFYGAMGEAAEEALKRFGLIPDNTGKIPTPFFAPGQKAYTFDGKTMHEMDGSKHVVSVSPSNTITYAGPNVPERNLNSSNAKEKEMMNLRTDFLNKPAGPQVIQAAAPGLSSMGGVVQAGLMAPAVQTPADEPKEITAYLAEVRSPDNSALKLVPTAVDIAKKLKLVDSKGVPYLTHKNNHWHNDPAIDQFGRQIQVPNTEYGVTIQWDRILGKDTPAEEQLRIMKILQAVQKGSIGDYKVVNKNEGYCLWCNVANNPTSVQKIADFFKDKK